MNDINSLSQERALGIMGSVFVHYKHEPKSMHAYRRNKDSLSMKYYHHLRGLVQITVDPDVISYSLRLEGDSVRPVRFLIE